MMKEKANVQSAAPRKVKGTVLFTVVCVMMVLIVFLMGTLALASTASKRAQTNYQKEQTEYQARAVLDAVVDVINQDTTGTGLKKDIAEGTVHSVPVTMDGDTYTVNITQMPSSFDKSVFVSESDGWKSVHVYAVSVNIGSQTTSADTVYTAYLTADLTNSGGGGGGGGGGGAFVSIGDLHGSNIGTGGYITGGSYVGVGNTTKNQYHIGTSGDVFVDAPLYVNGHLDTTKALTIHYTGNNDIFAVTGIFNPNHITGIKTSYEGYNLTTSAYEDLPVMYFGDLELNNQYYIGSEAVPTNVFAGKFNITARESADGMGIHGDLYGFDPAKTNTINPVNNNFTELYSWASSTIQNSSGEPQTFGNIFSAGKLVLGKNDVHVLNVEGSIRADKDVDSGANVVVGKDVVVGGTLKVTGNMDVSGNVYADTLILNADMTLHSGTVNVNHLYGTGKFINASAVNYADLPAPISASEETWYENVSLSFEKVSDTKYKIKYSGDRHEVEIVNGVAAPETITSVTDEESDAFSVETWYRGGDPEATLNGIDDWFAQSHSAVNAAQLYVALKTGAHIVVDKSAAQFDAAKLGGAAPTAASDVKSKYGTDVYPQAYTIDKMPDAVFSEPQATDYTTNYTTKVTELGTDIYDGGYKVPIYNNASYPADGFLEINNSCVLSGTMDKGNIYINPSSDITVILDNLNLSQDGGAGKVMLIVNDAFNVTFFVRGTCTLNSGLITTDYLDLFCGTYDVRTIRGDYAISNEVTINQVVPDGSPYLPNVIIYGEDGDDANASSSSKLEIPTGAHALITAQIRAPKMAFEHRMGKETSGINYVLPNGATKTYKDGTGDKQGNVGVIGQLIANEIKIVSDQGWGLIYVTNGDPRCEYCKTHGCTVCTGDSSCTCTCTGCTCHGGGGGGGGHGISYADKFNVLYYNIY